MDKKIISGIMDKKIIVTIKYHNCLFFSKKTKKKKKSTKKLY